MSNFSFNELFEEDNQVADFVDLSGNEDSVMNQILCNINTTPIGQVLKKIGSLPEVRQEKVLDVRRKLTEGNYNLGGRLDVALDKVLEDLIA